MRESTSRSGGAGVGETGVRSALKAKWLRFEMSDPNQCPAFRCDIEAFQNSFAAVEQMAFEQLSKGQKEDIFSLGFHKIRLTSEGSLTTGVRGCDTGALMRKLRRSVDDEEDEGELHVNRYDPKLQTTDHARTHIGLFAPDGSSATDSAKFGVLPAKAYALSKQNRALYNKHADALGRKLTDDAITEPPRGDLSYYVGPREAFDDVLQIVLDSGFDMGDLGDIGGVTKPYIYVSAQRYTGTAWHIEDHDLPSASQLFHGAPKIWVLVSPRHRKKFEKWFKKHFKADCSTCSQAVRHSGLISSPALLADADIDHRVVVQFPGEVIVTLPGAYHMVLNDGPNIAVAVNFHLAVEGLETNEEYKLCGRKCFIDKKHFLEANPREREALFRQMKTRLSRTPVGVQLEWEDDNSETEDARTARIAHIIEQMGSITELELLVRKHVGTQATTPAAGPSVAAPMTTPPTPPATPPAPPAMTNVTTGLVDGAGHTNAPAVGPVESPAPVGPRGEKRIAADKTTEPQSKRLKSVPRPLEYTGALACLRELVKAYSAERERNGPLCPVLSDMDDMRHLAPAILGMEGNSTLVQFQVRLLKLYMRLKYEDFYTELASARSGKQKKIACRGAHAGFARLVGVQETRIATLNQWLVTGKKMERLAGGKWEGRWVLALMVAGDMEKFGPKQDVDAWKALWEGNPGMVALKGVAEGFVRAIEVGGDFGVERIEEAVAVLTDGRDGGADV